MLQTIESEMHRIDQNLKNNQLEGLLEPQNLLRAAHKNLYDLTTITVNHSMAVAKDLEFQFETLFNAFVDEKK